MIITKRAKPIAELIPYEAEAEQGVAERDGGFHGDIISPVAAQDWEARK